MRLLCQYHLSAPSAVEDFHLIVRDAPYVMQGLICMSLTMLFNSVQLPAYHFLSTHLILLAWIQNCCNFVHTIETVTKLASK